MQLKERSNITEALATASCALLLVPSSADAQDNPWQFDSAVLYYDEDERVTAIEPVISASRQIGDDDRITLKLVVDNLTGASANGATPTDQTQTFTRPSGKGRYTIAAEDTPLDDTFRDTRTALNASWETSLENMWSRSFGLAISEEYDFFSTSFSGLVSKDLYARNTTLTAGISLEFDQISPVGDTPIGLASMAAPGETQARDGGEEEKNISELLFGWSQVLSPKAIMQVNYTFATSDGYHTDPYKLLSVVDSSSGETLDYIHEKRPQSRNKQSIYWQGKYHLEEDIVDLSYRYLWDDWDIVSHTIDFHYRWKLTDNSYLEPHYRYYRQEAANFYAYFLVDGEPLPTYASADYRLGDLTGQTLGIKYSYDFGRQKNLSLRLEQYLQSGNGSPSEAVGVLRNQDLYPNVEASIVQVSYSFSW